MKFILGASISINLGHDASITVIEDGKIVVHLQEERFNHLKHTSVPILCTNELSKYINKIDNIRFHHLRRYSVGVCTIRKSRNSWVLYGS